MSQDDASPPPSEPGPVWMTPVRARELAAAAEDLAVQLEQALVVRETDPDQARRDYGFRLHEVISTLRRDVAEQLLETASDLARLGARPEDACSLPSGVCTQHGPTLSQSGGEAWCTSPGCRRRWGYDRLTMPCAEPVTHAVQFTTGEVLEVCDGHAIEARQRLAGGVVTLLDAEDGAR